MEPDGIAPGLPVQTAFACQSMLGDFVAKAGLWAFDHRRQLVPVDQQTVIRSNRDTLYSGDGFDLDAAQVTVALPTAGGRCVINAGRRPLHVGLRKRPARSPSRVNRSAGRTHLA
jgi:hypothetical protein